MAVTGSRPESLPEVTTSGTVSQCPSPVFAGPAHGGEDLSAKSRILPVAPFLSWEKSGGKTERPSPGWLLIAVARPVVASVINSP